MSTFSSVMEYTIICSLTTCRVTAADNLTTFPKLSLGSKAVSSTCRVQCQTFTAERQQDRATVVWSGVAAASAAISQQYHQRQPVRRKATDCHSRPGRVVRRRAINALARFSGGTDMFLRSAPNTCSSMTTRPRRYSETSYSTCPVASGLWQRRAGRSSSFHTGTVPASPACSGTHCYGSQAT